MELLHGPLNLVLRVGRVFGIAPVTFNNKRITVSTPLYYFSILFGGIIELLALGSFAVDVETGKTTRKVRIEGNLQKVMVIIGLIFKFLSSTYGIIEAPKRLRSMVVYMKQVESIKLDLRCNNISQWSDMKRRIFFIVIVSYLLILSFLDCIYLVLFLNYMDMNLTAQYLYVAAYIRNIVFQLLLMQFVFVVFTVNDLLKALNYHLENVLRLVCMQFESPQVWNLSSSVDKIKGRDTFNKQKETKMLIGWTDETGHSEGHTLSSKSGPVTIRCLTQSYNDICGVVRQIDDAHGPLTLLLMLTNTIQLIISPFYLILEITADNIWPSIPILQFLWCMYYLLFTLVLIEPCHQTYIQTQRTQIIVSELICRLDPSDPMSPALDKFFQQLLLNTPSYTLGNVATLGRPLLASLLGSVTTYLVIIIQFQSYEKK